MADEKPNLPKDSDLIGALSALRRAAQRARQIAQQTHTPCYILRDGRLVDIAQEKTIQG
ncbi:MAG: hypothetical protein WC091_26125 [Sulfuricellaceae bacterium]